MLHDAADEPVRLPAESVRIVFVLEDIFSVLIQGHIDMHPRTVDAILRLRHKSSVQSVALCNRAHCQLESHNMIRCRQSLIILKINFVLGGCHLMMGCLHYKPHILQCHDNITPCILSLVKRADVEIARLLAGLRRGHCILIRVE